jgi:tungstate transport system substrate-binding protein
MRRLILILTVALVGAIPTSALASDVIVQGTTDIRDAGLLNDVIIPQFQAKYPQYTVKYIAVGTGQALTNAEAGQGDAVVTHAPTLEADFVQQGYSLVQRSVFYSDYVILGPQSDPAGVLASAPHNAVAAYEAIAAAGAQGKANFVSRGDNSGTNVQEKAIWALTNVPLNSAGEPAGPNGTGNPSWYHKAGLGQADTVQLTQQCPFSGGACYEMTDRGTFNRLVALGTVTALIVVSDKNTADAPGGTNLLLNPFSAYVVNPAKVTNVQLNVDGAKAFVDFLTSADFQKELATYPSATNPAFFADAMPSITISGPPPAKVTAGKPLSVSGSIANLLPGAPAISGATVQLQTAPSLAAPTPVTVGQATTDASGKFTISGPLNASGPLQVAVPQFGAFTATSQTLGSVQVQAAVSLKSVARRGHRVTLRGSALPSAARKHAVLYIKGHRQGRSAFSTLKKVSLRSGSSAYRQSITLKPGKWSLRVGYSDSGNVLPATSRVVHVSVR